MNGYKQGGYEGAIQHPYETFRMPGVRRRQALVLPLLAGLLIALLFLPFLWMFFRQSGQFERGAIVILFVPLVGGPLLMVGFQRPAVGLMLAAMLGLLDWRLGGRFVLFGEVMGIATNPSNIFFLLLFLQSFFWRSCRRVPRVFWVYAVMVFVGGALGLLVTVDMESSISAFILRLVVPGVIAINAIRSLDSPDELDLVWLGVLVVAQLAVLYNMALGFSGELGFGRHVFGGNAFSIACACFMPVAVSWGLGHSRRLYCWVGRIASILFMLQIWVQSSRTAISVTALFILTTTVLRFRRVLFSPLYVVLLGMVAVGGAGYYVRSYAVVSGAQRQTERFKEFFETGIRGSNRWAVWNEATDVISDNPVLGTGMNAFTEASWLGQYMHPHQILLAMWLDTGLIGLLAFVILSVYLVLATVVGTSRAPPGVYADTCWAAAAMVIMLFLTLQVEGYLYCGTYLIGTWVFHLIVVSAFVAIALARERRWADLWPTT